MAAGDFKGATILMGRTTLSASHFRVIDDPDFYCLLFFPRSDFEERVAALPAKSRKVRFRTEFPTGIRIEREFDLATMIYQGEIDF
jgi:hypothetical protein